MTLFAFGTIFVMANPDLVKSFSSGLTWIVEVRRILKKHGDPPDLQDEATKLVLEQVEVLCADWAT